MRNMEYVRDEVNIPQLWTAEHNNMKGKDASAMSPEYLQSLYNNIAILDYFVGLQSISNYHKVWYNRLVIKLQQN